MTAAIDIQHLSLRRSPGWRKPEVNVLNDLCLRVPEGAVVGLVGRNGAGKTSLIRCLVGLELPSAGTSRLLDDDSRTLSADTLERLGYGPQSPELVGWLDGHAHLRKFATGYRRYDVERAHRIARQLDLPMHTAAAKLSLGDQQKLSVLLALAHDPDLLVLDEPVASLDPLARREFMRALFAEHDDGDGERARTVLLSSHLLSDLSRVVSHVAFLREGRVQLFGAWDELSEHLRAWPCPTQPEPGLAGLVHWSAALRQAVVDVRQWAGPTSELQAMDMDGLFEALNA